MNKVTYIVIAIAVVAILITIFSARMAIKNAQASNGKTTTTTTDEGEELPPISEVDETPSDTML